MFKILCGLQKIKDILNSDLSAESYETPQGKVNPIGAWSNDIPIVLVDKFDLIEKTVDYLIVEMRKREAKANEK